MGRCFYYICIPCRNMKKDGYEEAASIAPRILPLWTFFGFGMNDIQLQSECITEVAETRKT